MEDEGGEGGEQSCYEGIASVRGGGREGKERKRERWTDLNTTAWYRMKRECPVGGDRGDDLDSDGPEPLATVGQLSSPRFASFFEPPLYTHQEEILLLVELFQQRARYMLSSCPPPPCRTCLPGSRVRFSHRAFATECAANGSPGFPLFSIFAELATGISSANPQKRSTSLRPIFLSLSLKKCEIVSVQVFLFHAIRNA